DRVLRPQAMYKTLALELPTIDDHGLRNSLEGRFTTSGARIGVVVSLADGAAPLGVNRTACNIGDYAPSKHCIALPVWPVSSPQDAGSTKISQVVDLGSRM